MSDDRIMRTLKISLCVILLVGVVLWLLSVSCMSGWCSTHKCFENKKDGFEWTDGVDESGNFREGFKMNVDHVGGYYQIGYNGCKCGCIGPRFSLSRGAGQYAFMKGQPQENGFYGPAGDNITPQKVNEYAQKHYDPTKTPSCQAANCGLNNIPKCQCGKSQCLCCRYQARRGCHPYFNCGAPQMYGNCNL